ncbi:MAG: hypothetical protein HZA13_01095 [Nitrospirae bacterium]|nr:hypothetical protein [Nitrospirota bacterium]
MAISETEIEKIIILAKAYGVTRLILEQTIPNILLAAPGLSQDLKIFLGGFYGQV